MISALLQNIHVIVSSKYEELHEIKVALFVLYAELHFRPDVAKTAPPYAARDHFFC